jgi:hypothetical protein
MSLLSDEKKERVTTLTRPSFKKKKWFLNIYQKDQKFSINLFPGNFHVQKEAFAEYFDTVADGKGQTNLDNLEFSLNDILGEYGINEDKKISRIGSSGVKISHLGVDTPPKHAIK